MFLLLGADPRDAAMAGFADYLASRSIPHMVCSDLGQLGFGVYLDACGRTAVRLHVPGHGTVRGDEVAVFVRNPWMFALAKEDSADARFAGNEYYAALWAVCALLPKVINRPGPQAWQYDREVRRSLERSSLLPEYWTTDPGRLLDRRDACASPEVHVEDLLTHECRIIEDPGDLGGRLNPGASHLRAVCAPSSRYVVHVCVGQRSFTVLNEPDVDVDEERHRTLLRDLTDTLSRRGIRFFAVALVTDYQQRPMVSRILTDPPFSWYRAHADAVHEQLCAELARPFPEILESTR
ncbi:hypothetical protein [Streptomyces sp. NPDC003719]